MEYDPLVVVREELQPPPGHDWFAKEQAPGQPPLFTTREVSMIFFARTRVWLQLLLTVDDRISHEIQPLRLRTGPDGYRRLNLRQIEQIAHILFKYGIVDFDRFLNGIRIIKAIASNYHLLTGE